MKFPSLLLALSCVSAMATDNLFDLSQPDALSKWIVRTTATDKLTLVDTFAKKPQRSLRFTTPTWKEGMEQWPAFETKPTITDWSPYDRIAFTVTNLSTERQSLSLFASDDKVPFRQGLSSSVRVEAGFTTRLVIPMSKFPSNVNRKALSIVHFFTQRPTADFDMIISAAVLLKKGEQLPPMPTEIVKRSQKALLDSLAAARKAFEESVPDMEKLCITQEMTAHLHTELRLIRSNLTRRENIIKDMLDFEKLEEENIKLASLLGDCTRLMSVLTFESNCVKANTANAAILATPVTSMKKVLPRHVTFDYPVSNAIDLTMAANETECFQMAVMPRVKELKNATVTVSVLNDDAGHTLKTVETAVVGYVQTVKTPPYKVSHVGWWPDPILDFQKSCDIARNDIQTFWIRIKTPKTQVAGIYRGTVKVSAKGTPALTFPISVKVRNFALMDFTPLPTAIAFGGKPSMVSPEDWKTKKFAYADFLADYMIDYDNIYRQDAPDWDIIKRLHKQGRLVCFNLGNVFNGGIDAKSFEVEMKKTIERIRPAYTTAKKLGLLDHAYIYGFDERGKDQFPILERCAQELRKAFPEVLLMTTSYDDSFGADSVVKTIDAWCPLTPKFDIPKALNARKSGKFVWWYICCGPHNPHANWFVEYDAIESRLLMGAMTSKYRPDGFLYYAISIWNQNKGIGKGPFTSWNPVSWTTYHGDGSLFHCDDKGNPLPSIRLENYRDGMEDYAYTVILENRLKAVQKQQPDSPWIAQAQKALTVPETLVKTMADYSHDPALLRQWRDAMGDAIETCPIKDAAKLDAQLKADVRGLK